MEEERSHYIPLPLRILAGTLMRERNESGKTVNQISEQTGISNSHLYLLEEKSYLDSEMKDLPRSGAPQKFTEHTERRLLRAMKKDPFQTCTEITRDLNEGMDEEEKVSVRTVRHHANLKGLTAHRPW